MEGPASKEITNRERIRRIIGILRLDGREVELHLPHYIEVAKITDTTQDMFTVKLSSPLLDFDSKKIKSIHITFVFSGVELFGKCSIINQSGAKLTIDYPESLMSRSKRRYPRISFTPVVSAKLKFKQYPEKKFGEVSSKDLPVKYSKLYWEVQRDTVDIKKIFLLCGAEIKKISPLSEIVLYNKGNLGARDVQILRKSGKVLYVDDCRTVQSYTRLIPSDKIISYSYYLNEKRIEGVTKDKIIEELKEIMKQVLQQKYTSKVLVPIFSKDEVIGHIKAVLRETRRKLTYENIADLMSLSALLTMGIARAGFVPDLGNAVDSDLLDISEGGIFLKISDEGTGQVIKEGTDIELKFAIKDEEVALRGSVIRKDSETHSYAVQFSSLGQKERRAIKKYIDSSIEGDSKK